MNVVGTVTPPPDMGRGSRATAIITDQLYQWDHGAGWSEPTPDLPKRGSGLMVPVVCVRSRLCGQLVAHSSIASPPVNYSS